MAKSGHSARIEECADLLGQTTVKCHGCRVHFREEGDELFGITSGRGFGKGCFFNLGLACVASFCTACADGRGREGAYPWYEGERDQKGEDIDSSLIP